MRPHPVTRVVFDDRVGLDPVLMEGATQDRWLHAAVLRMVQDRVRPGGASKVGLGAVQRFRHTLTIVDGIAPIASVQLVPLVMVGRPAPCPRCGASETLAGQDPDAPIGDNVVFARCMEPGCGWYTTAGARLVREAVTS